MEQIVQDYQPEWEQPTTVFYRIDDNSLGQSEPEAVTRLLQFLLRTVENFQVMPARFVAGILKDIASSEDCPREEFEAEIDRAVELRYISSEDADDLIKNCLKVLQTRHWTSLEEEDGGTDKTVTFRV